MDIKTGIIDTVESLLTNAVESFDSMSASACTVLTNGIGTATDANGNTTGIWQMVVDLSQALMPFCNIIIGICVLIELARIASKVDMLKWEHGLKVGVKMCIAKFLMEISPTFLEACYNQAGIFITSLSGFGASTSMADVVTPYIGDACKEVDSIGGAIGLLCSTLLLIMGIKLCGLIINIMAYGRMFEILVYLLVSPIPVAFACYNNGDGISRITMKFFKSFIAVCLSGVMMYMCIRIFGMIITVEFQGLVETSAEAATGAALVSDLCYDMILFTIVLVMAVVKCGGWAKQIMDA